MDSTNFSMVGYGVHGVCLCLPVCMPLCVPAEAPGSVSLPWAGTLPL